LRQLNVHMSAEIPADIKDNVINQMRNTLYKTVRSGQGRIGGELLLHKSLLPEKRTGTSM